MSRRILLSIVVLTTVAVIAFAVPLAFVLANLHHEQEVVRLQRAAAEAAERVPTTFPDATDPIELHGARKGLRISIYDRAGKRVGGNGPANGDAVVKEARRGDLQDGERGNRLVVASPLLRGERVLGIIRVEKSLDAVHERTRNAILVMVAIGAGAVGFSALIGFYQSRRLARPVDQLARAAARLGNGDFTVRSEKSGVSEVDAVSEALETTAARLERMLARERSFSDAASHQLRTPLTGLRLNLESARLDPARPRDAVLDDALGEVDRLERTIDDLLTLSRESERERPVLDVETCVAAIEDDWHGLFAHAGRPLRVLVDRDLPVARASDRAVRQILEVLLDNALKHGDGVVTIRARSAASGLVVEVSDEGPGISDDSGGVFDQQISGSANHGIGLGLARSLADAEGGSLRLERTRPGATFALVLRAAST